MLRSLRSPSRHVLTLSPPPASPNLLWFCNVADFCPSFIGTLPVRWDGSHLTPAYSAALGPELAAVIKRAMT